MIPFDSVRNGHKCNGLFLIIYISWNYIYIFYIIKSIIINNYTIILYLKRSGWRHVYVVMGLVYNSYFGNQVYNTAEIYCREIKIIPKAVYLRNTDFPYAFVIIHLGFSVVRFFHYLKGSSITIFSLYFV